MACRSLFCWYTMGHSMDKVEIQQLVKEEVGASAAHYFGLLKELIMDQFAVAAERHQMFEEKADRQLEKIEQDLEQIKRNTDINSLEILALQDKDHESWRKTTQIEQECKLLDKRISKLETNYNYV